MANKKTKYLTKADILEVDDRGTSEVEVPEWGGTVLVRAPSSWEMSEFQNRQIQVSTDDKGRPSSRVDLTGSDARLAALCIVNEDGERQFSEKDVRKLGEKSARALDRVVAAIRELEGMEEALEVLEGNSE